MAVRPFSLWWPTRAALVARYARPTSRFLDVRGTPIHVLDEGPPDGPPVVLLPGQWISARQWLGWLPALANRYRMICVDLPGHGLAEPFTDGDYSFENYIRLVSDLVDDLGLRRFALVGTSFSGTVAFRYAADNAHRVVALILANASGLPRQGPGRPNAPPDNLLHRLVLPWVRPRGFIAGKLASLVHDKQRLTPDLVDEVTAFNNLPGRFQEAAKRAASYRVGDPQSVLARITAPTLVQWATGSTYLSTREADLFIDWLGAAVKEKIIYPGTGHLIAVDAPEATGRDAGAFLDRNT
ncbi:MAG: alpha/beta hydrolase [Rhodospirillaceae bacterium]|nr:alpha/beta hydrolase [Rhodospirillaceae bacterium]